jgi:exosortase E/protease (VPEID-CTERM system)
VRIAVLVVIGSAGWPDIAFGGFHSKAGWFLFCTIGLAVVVLSRRVRFFSRVRERAQETENPTAAFVTPLLLLLVVGMLTSTFAAGVDRLYPLRVIGASLALLAHRDAYRGAVGRPSQWAVPIGALVFALWWWFTPASPDRVAAFHELFGFMSPLERAIWIAFRVVGACIVVPAAEELAFRGFLQRRLIAEDFTAVPAGTFGWLSFIATSLAFGALHTNWLLGFFAGAAYSAAVYARGRLADAILAHATTNALLALSAFAFGRWDFW